MQKARVLFLGTRNTGRSQMAEALLRRQAGDRYESYSAGIEPDEAINPYTRLVMEEVGLELGEQRPKNVSEYLGRVHFGYVITVCDWAEQNCPTTFMGISKRLHWALEDPLKFHGSEAETLAKFREVRDAIDAEIRGWLEQQA